MRRAWVALVFAIAAHACGTPGTTCGDAADACDAAPADVPTNDVLRDAMDVIGDTPTDVPRDTSDARTCPLFDCVCDPLQCGTGSTCNSSFPGGLCTRACTTSDACGTGVCDPVLGCLPSCTPHGGLECDQYGAACFRYGDAATDFVCRPSCFPAGTTAPPGYTSCRDGLVCDPNTLECTNTLSTGGAMVGEPCTRDADCATRHCFTEIDAAGAPTGFLGGQCYAVGRIPSGDAYQRGMPLPRANCPIDSAALPISADDAEGDPSLCLPTCESDADCGRDGYTCNRFLDASGNPPFTNGACVPTNCADPSQSCPSGAHCVTTASDASMAMGICATDGTSGDAGDDVATDAIDESVDATE